MSKWNVYKFLVIIFGGGEKVWNSWLEELEKFLYFFFLEEFGLSEIMWILWRKWIKFIIRGYYSL